MAVKKAGAKAGAGVRLAASGTAGSSSRPFAVFRGVVKVVSLLVGFVAAMLCVAALIGALTASGWARWLGALALLVVVPAVVTDRLLPKSDDFSGARGLIGDVLAVSWLGVTVLFVVALASFSSKHLATEGDRLTLSGYESLAWVVYRLAGVEPAPQVEAEPSLPAASASIAPAVPSAAVSSEAAAPVSASAPAASGPVAPPAASTQAPEPAPQDAETMTPAELFKEFAPAVVAVTQLVADSPIGGGTGFVVDDQGTIVTNHHVIAEAKQLRVKFMDGTLYEDIELLAQDRHTDLAILRINREKPKHGDPVELKPVRLGDSEKVVVGERAVAIGNPLGLDHTLTDGLVSARRVHAGRNWIQISVPVSPGNSGGPLFNLHGDVIGITTAQVASLFGRAQNLNLAVPVNTLAQMLKQKYQGKRKVGDGEGPKHW